MNALTVHLDSGRHILTVRDTKSSPWLPLVPFLHLADGIRPGSPLVPVPFPSRSLRLHSSLSLPLPFLFPSFSLPVPSLFAIPCPFLFPLPLPFLFPSSFLPIPFFFFLPTFLSS